ncbi:hypothetical protein C8R41DRAFT_95634 [Lentinula lateritia]|uniref:Uncharacterized protein n=1 Tax=Lentinula lateritia TaxID=40482 RepID=A0ABQ8UY78_9AGAR|nr:hypothetical protein C8R41DRAFT_95634 [Lentinula lateritia]
MLETYLPDELGILLDLDLTLHGIWVPLVTKMVNAGCTGARKLVVGNHEANLSGGPPKQSSKAQFGVGPSVSEKLPTYANLTDVEFARLLQEETKRLNDQQKADKHH